MNLFLRSTTTIILSTLIAQATTQLSHQGKTLFSADTKVSYGAVYDAHAIKAVIDSPTDTAIRIFTGKKPRRLFLNHEPMADNAWSYDDGASCVTLPLPAGRQALQARFDDLASVKPFAATIPVPASPANRKTSRRREPGRTDNCAANSSGTKPAAAS